MSDLCEHQTFKDICGICHRDGVIARLTAENERLRTALWDCHALANNWQGVTIIGTQFDRIRKTARAALTGATEKSNG